ncbi:DUF3889 domain-containing protein [Cytobacillus sp. S13-E01]|nr:DUF3889 domain-containing protein [Cytobacillus sp. S13-E01]
MMFVSIFTNHYTYVLQPEKVSAQSQLGKVPVKWGKLAMKEVQKKYPAAKILDYQHIWREKKKDGTGLERFTFSIKQYGREYNVHVTIVYDLETKTVKDVQFIEMMY